MLVSPVERPVASAAYGFVRFIGGGLAPFAAGKLAEHFNVHVPFCVGAGAVVAAIAGAGHRPPDARRAPTPAWTRTGTPQSTATGRRRRRGGRRVRRRPGRHRQQRVHRRPPGARPERRTPPGRSPDGVGWCGEGVELRGFEPLTPSMRTRCATGLRHSPFRRQFTVPARRRRHRGGVGAPGRRFRALATRRGWYSSMSANPMSSSSRPTTALCCQPAGAGVRAATTRPGRSGCTGASGTLGCGRSARPRPSRARPSSSTGRCDRRADAAPQRLAGRGTGGAAGGQPLAARRPCGAPARSRRRRRRGRRCARPQPGAEDERADEGQHGQGDQPAEGAAAQRVHVHLQLTAGEQRLAVDRHPLGLGVDHGVHGPAPLQRSARVGQFRSAVPARRRGSPPWAPARRTRARPERPRARPIPFEHHLSHESLAWARLCRSASPNREARGVSLMCCVAGVTTEACRRRARPAPAARRRA